MQQKSRSRQRLNEVITGMVIILAGFSLVIALLMDFKLGSPFSTLQEDLAYLTDHSVNQKISTWAWLATSFLSITAIPFYVAAFHKKLRFLHLVNALLMLGAATGALMMGLAGLEINQDLTQGLIVGADQASEQLKIGILEHFKDEKFYTRLGGTCAALLAFNIGLTRFRMARFPMISTLLLMVSGPALIYFNWYNPDHILRTVAMAGIIIGFLILCLRLINKGM